MTATSLAALITAVTALIGAVGGVVAVIKHTNGPAHQDPPAASTEPPKPSVFDGHP